MPTETQIQALERLNAELTELVSTQAQVISDQSRDNNVLASENQFLKILLWRILEGNFKDVIPAQTISDIESSTAHVDMEKSSVGLRLQQGGVLSARRF